VNKKRDETETEREGHEGKKRVAMRHMKRHKGRKETLGWGGEGRARKTRSRKEREGGKSGSGNRAGVTKPLK